MSVTCSLCLTSVGLVLALSVLAQPSVALAQRPDSLPVGARVRVATRFMNPRTITGVLEAADSSSIAFRPDGRSPLLLDYREIESIAVGRREPRPGGATSGAKRGLRFGLGTTVIAAAVSTAIALAVGYRPSGYSLSVPLTVAILGVPFTILSTAVGAVIGTTDRTVWEQVWPR